LAAVPDGGQKHGFGRTRREKGGAKRCQRGARLNKAGGRRKVGGNHYEDTFGAGEGLLHRRSIVAISSHQFGTALLPGSGFLQITDNTAHLLVFLQ
jgi:hypothetical protein